MLNIAVTHRFKLNQIFDEILPTKGLTTDDLISGKEIPYIGATKARNGFMEMVAKEGNEEFISDGNCIVFVQLGAGGAGYVTYQSENFIGMNGKTCCGYSKHLNRYTGLFLATVLCQERFRYSFGRSWTGDRLLNTEIELPAKVDKNGIYEPDWQYMENYIKSLNVNLPKTTNKTTNTHNNIDTQNWQSFKIGKLFDLEAGKVSSTDVLSDGNDIYYCGAKKDENGIIAKYSYDKKYVSKGNCIVFICDGQGAIGYNNYMDKDFIATVNLMLGYNKHLNKYNAMFFVSVLDLERPKFSFGRKRKKTLSDAEIKLPAKLGSNGKYEPDWQYMEDYIKSLPYGDVI